MKTYIAFSPERRELRKEWNARTDKTIGWEQFLQNAIQREEEAHLRLSEGFDRANAKYNNVHVVHVSKDFDKIWRSIERKIGANIVALHAEAKNYAFKTFSGEWRTIYIPFANDAAGLGYVNESLL